MPEFVDVASHFDDVSTFDGYLCTFAFYSQMNTFDESSLDGAITKKRTMSVRPGTTVPVRGCISAEGERWLVGDPNIDSFQDAAIRQSYWMKKVTDSIEILTPGNACLGLVGVSAYAHLSYLKDTVNSATDAQYDPFWEIYTGSVEPIYKGSILKSGAKWYRVRTSHRDLSGLVNSASDELDQGAFINVTLDGGVYDPITDSYTGSVVSVPCIKLDRYKLYELVTDADPLNHAGDLTLLVSNSVTITVGQLLSINSENWQVLTKTPEQDAWNLHVRRA